MKAEYIDHMGSDLTVVNSARVSFDKESEWAHPEFGPDRLKVLWEKDQKLINYLSKNGHWTPFSHVVITMRETIPIFVARQRFKHMVGFTYNEVSRRYVDESPDYYVFPEFRTRAENLKQGSLEVTHPQSKEWVDKYILHMDNSIALYDDMIANGVPPEQARAVLPQGVNTSYYVTGSLAAWARAYHLRIDGHAQKEIQLLAQEWDKVISNLKELNVSWKALKGNQSSS